MISENINLQGLFIEFVLIVSDSLLRELVCYLFAFALEDKALNADAEWNEHLRVSVLRRVPTDLNYVTSDFRKMYGMEETLYLLERKIIYEKIVLIFLVLFSIACVVHLVFCIISKDFGQNRIFYEVFFTFGFFLQVIAVAMYFLSVHTYSVHLQEWEMRNQEFFLLTPDTKGIFSNIIGKTRHPCTAESQEELSKSDLKIMEKAWGPYACQLYETKLTVLVLMVIACICSLWIIIFVSQCCHIHHSSITTVLSSSESSTVVIMCDDPSAVLKNSRMIIDDNSNSINPETLLTKFRSELAMIDKDGKSNKKGKPKSPK